MDPAEGPVARFAFELRKLRQEAGGLTYRQMAARTSFSAGTLAQAAAGGSLPSLPVALAYVSACGGRLEDWQRRWHQAREQDLAEPPGDDDGAVSPYMGLRRFQPQDREVFFGRDQLIADLTSLVRGHRVTVVVGASGSGKSSLLRAGLIPVLQSADAGERPAALRIFTPGSRPAGTHAHLLSPEPSGADTVIVVDQFEEIFTLCSDPAEREAFIGLLLAARTPGSRLRVVIAVRADFFGRLAEHPALAAAVREATLLVTPMTPVELRDAIVKPAAAAGLIVERVLTARLVDDVTGHPGSLPLMSHVLLETWRRRRKRTLTLAAYEAAGGIHGAIAQTAEALHTHLHPSQARHVRQIMLRLVTPGDGAPDTRRPAGRDELDSDQPGETGQVLERLARARLLILDDNTVEIAHEALLTAWPRLRDWIEQDRQHLHVHRQLTEAATTWEQLDRDTGALYRGTRLEQATRLDRGSLSAAEQAFLDACLAAQAAEHTALRRRMRLRRQAVALLSFLLLIATSAAIWAIGAQRAANQQRDVAVSRELAARSDALLSQQPEAAMLMALKGFQRAPTVEARSSLISAYSMYGANQLTGHTQSVQAVAFSPDGHTLASAGKDHSVKLWNTATRQLIATLRGHTDTVNALAFSPDGHTLATVSADHSIKLWNPATHRETATLTGHTSAVNALAFSPDGHTLATAGGEGGIRLWNTHTHETTATFAGHTRAVLAVAFAPDGRTLATAGADRTVRVWNTASRRTTATLTGHTNEVRAVAFSPDGHTLATGSDDFSLRLWNVATQQLISALNGHSDSVTAVAFSRDGRTLASASADGTAKLWNPATRRDTATLTFRGGFLNALAFSPDDQTLATAGADGTVRLWSTATRIPIAELGGEVYAAEESFSPDGHTLATTSGEAVQLWDVSRRRPVATLAGPDNSAYAMAFSPDGHTLATTGADRTVRLWNTATHRQTAVLRGHHSSVLAAAFSPDGQILATASYDHTVRLWNVAHRRLVDVLRGHTDAVFDVAYSPDGRTLATTGADGTVRLWDTTSHQTSAVLTGHKDAVYAVQFSPDGRSFATASADRTAKLWDTATHQATATLTGHSDAVTKLAFSPNGETLITASHDHTMRLWNVRTRRTEAVLRGHTDMITGMALSPDGRTLASSVSLTAPGSSELRLWDLDTGQIAQHICQASNAHHWSQLLSDTPGAGACS
ncbi:nSTAND1 domain-containing NTPase [Streptomyces sp. B21-083]|uniref:nSTAND1 domain-containing NTPase n=1 Tax=Streptomyces sp. B21-083 TaxID=3039410 RepID=UPI002FEEAE5B